MSKDQQQNQPPAQQKQSQRITTYSSQYQYQYKYQYEVEYIPTNLNIILNTNNLTRNQQQAVYQVIVEKPVERIIDIDDQNNTRSEYTVGKYINNNQVKVQQKTEQQKAKQTVQKALNQKLILACKKHNLEQIDSLIKQGASANFVQFVGGGDWYSGDTQNPLYAAVHSDFEEQEQENYIKVIELLIKNGADVQFQARKGHWSHSSQYHIFTGASQILSKFKHETNKIRFLQILAKAGANLNQQQQQERSKNHRGYRTHTCFIFQMMDSLGIKSKILELSKLIQTVNIRQLRSQKQSRIREKFYQQFPYYRQVNQQKQNLNYYIPPLQVKSDLPPNIDLIKVLLDLGVDPNSYASEWNYSNGNVLTRNYHYNPNYQIFKKFDENITQTYETVLHRAIMNNLYELVKILIDKGAKIDQKCKFTIRKAVYPCDWPQPVKLRQIQKNQQRMKKYQTQLTKAKQAYNSAGTEQAKKEIQRYQVMPFHQEVYKCQLFSVESECPLSVCEDKQLDCVELAQIVNASPQIIQLLKPKIKKA